MQSRHLHSWNRTYPLDTAQLEAARPQQHDVAFANPNMLRALGPFEILGKDRIARFEPFNSANTRNIKEHATRDYAVAGDLNRALVRALEVDLAIIESIVHFAVIKMMAEGIEMRGRQAV